MAETRERSAELDVVRACAVLIVVLAHAYLLSGEPAPRGHSVTNMLLSIGASGVWLFFALSGFLITGPFVRALVTGTPGPDLRRYAVRRTARIFPAYWIAFTALLATTSARVGLGQGIVHYALLHNLVPGQEYAVYFASWTLTLEVLFYVSVPVATALAARLSRTYTAERLAVAVVSIAVLSVLLSMHGLVTHRYGTTGGLWVSTVFPSMAGMFCFGILAFLERMSVDERAAIWRPYRALLRAPWLAGALVAALLVAGAAANTTPQPELHLQSRWLFGAGYGLFLGLVLRHGLPRFTRVLVPIGVISYGLYLWHTVIAEWLLDGRHGHWRPLEHGGFTAWVVHSVFLLAVSSVFAGVSWLVVERPAIAWAARGVALGHRVVPPPGHQPAGS